MIRAAIIFLLFVLILLVYRKRRSIWLKFGNKGRYLYYLLLFALLLFILWVVVMFYYADEFEMMY